MLPGAGGVRGADRGHGRSVLTVRAAEALEPTVAVELGLPSGDGPTDGLATPGATGRGGAGARLLLLGSRLGLGEGALLLGVGVGEDVPEARMLLGPGPGPVSVSMRAV